MTLEPIQAVIKLSYLSDQRSRQCGLNFMLQCHLFRKEVIILMVTLKENSITYYKKNM